jgi:hypothetical protein
MLKNWWVMHLLLEFKSVIFIMAIRIIFLAVPGRISKSLDKRRKLPNQENVRSTTHRFGKTAHLPSIFSEMCKARPSPLVAKSTAVPR